MAADITLAFGEISATSALLTNEELGVYVRMLALYYEQEASISEAQVERIIKTVAAGNRECVEYILHNFFQLVDGEWHNGKADRALAHHEKRVARAKKACSAMWEKKQATSKAQASSKPASEASKQEAIDSNEEKVVSNASPSSSLTSSNRGGVGEEASSSLSSSSRKPISKQLGGKSIIHRLTLTSLPEEWKAYASQVRPDIDPVREFESFRFYFTEGKGADKFRSDRGWASSWQGWVRRAKARTTTVIAPRPQRQPDLNSIHFDSMTADQRRDYMMQE